MDKGLPQPQRSARQTRYPPGGLAAGRGVRVGIGGHGVAVGGCAPAHAGRGGYRQPQSGADAEYLFRRRDHPKLHVAAGHCRKAGAGWRRCRAPGARAASGQPPGAAAEPAQRAAGRGRAGALADVVQGDVSPRNAKRGPRLLHAPPRRPVVRHLHRAADPQPLHKRMGDHHQPALYRQRGPVCRRGRGDAGCGKFPAAVRQDRHRRAGRHFTEHAGRATAGAPPLP